MVTSVLLLPKVQRWHPCDCRDGEGLATIRFVLSPYCKAFIRTDLSLGILNHEGHFFSPYKVRILPSRRRKGRGYGNCGYEVMNKEIFFSLPLHHLHITLFLSTLLFFSFPLST